MYKFKYHADHKAYISVDNPYLMTADLFCILLSLTTLGFCRTEANLKERILEIEI